MAQPKTYASRKQAAFEQGLAAFKEGKSPSDCPIHKHQGLRRAWNEGWTAGSSEQKKQSSGMFIGKVPAPSPISEPLGQPAVANG